LFEAKQLKHDKRFTYTQAIADIISKVEERAKLENFNVKKRHITRWRCKGLWDAGNDNYLLLQRYLR